MFWSRRLLQPIALNDCRRLATPGDVAEVVLALRDSRLLKACWDEAIDLLIGAAISPLSALAQAEAQLKVAFTVEGLT
jgi:hypothetical protein